MTKEQINKEAQRLFKLNPKADKVFVSNDCNSFFNEGDAINHKRSSKVEYTTVSKADVITKAEQTEEDRAIAIIEKMNGKEEKEIIAALKKEGISDVNIKQLTHNSK